MRKFKYRLIACLLLITSFLNNVRAQISDLRSAELYKTILFDYLSIYNTIWLQGQVDQAKFIGLFQKDVKIENDYCKIPGATKVFDNAEDYFNDITETFDAENKAFSGLLMVLPKSERDMIFCQENNFYHVWINKVISYNYNNKREVIETWVRLKITVIGNKFKIIEIKQEEKPIDNDRDNVADITMGKSVCDICQNTKKGNAVNINGCWNNDLDEDGVPNDIDLCPSVPGSASAHGCPDQDRDGIKDSEDACPDSKGPRSNAGCPISGLAISVAGGGILPFGTPYSEQRILNTQTSKWINNSSLASYGLLFNASLQYNFSTWLGLGIGGLNFTTKFDANRLKVNLDVFLSRNGAPANEVSVTSDAYQFNIAYAKLSLGNYNNGKHSFKIEPTIGQAFKGFSKNETLIRINYQNGGTQSDRITFTTAPFLVYGGDLKYELWLSKAFGLAFSTWYLTGTNKFETQEVQFANLPDKLQITSQRMQLVGASVGLQFYLAKGKEYYKYGKPTRSRVIR